MSEYSVGDAITFTGPLGEKGLMGKITEIKPLPPVYIVTPDKPYKMREQDKYGLYTETTKPTLTVHAREITGKTGAPSAGRRRKTKKSKRRHRKTRRRHK